MCNSTRFSPVEYNLASLASDASLHTCEAGRYAAAECIVGEVQRLQLFGGCQAAGCVERPQQPIVAQIQILQGWEL